MIDKATSQKAENMSILSFALGGLAPIASTIGTPNILSYMTPDWDGFTVDTTYSFNPLVADEADLGSRTRPGRGWNVNPNWRGKDFQIGYSYWDARTDGQVFADQRSDRLYGSYTWGGFKLGFAWDRSMLKVASTGLERSNRRAWSLPMHYKTGPHSIFWHYSRAQDDKATAGKDGARMIAVAYTYDLSKSTSLGVTHARINNDPAAVYNFFGTTGNGGTPSVAVAPGESPRIWAMTMRYAF